LLKHMVSYGSYLKHCIEFVFRYEPGQWLVEAGGMKKNNFAIPVAGWRHGCREKHTRQ
jgi:hypothetical protein